MRRLLSMSSFVSSASGAISDREVAVETLCAAPARISASASAHTPQAASRPIEDGKRVDRDHAQAEDRRGRSRGCCSKSEMSASSSVRFPITRKRATRLSASSTNSLSKTSTASPASPSVT
jgi:hypothetical protein